MLLSPQVLCVHSEEPLLETHLERLLLLSSAKSEDFLFFYFFLASLAIFK